MSFFSDLATFSFLQYALIAVLLGSVACGTVGTFVVIRRSTYLAGALSHGIMGGLGFSQYAMVVIGLQWFTPMVGALIAAVTSALVVAWFETHNRERVDTVLSLIWALGMAVGISFIVATPGYATDLMGYLFGDVLVISSHDLLMMGILNALIVAVTLSRFSRLVGVSFQPQLMEVRGVSVVRYHALLLILIAITIVVLIRLMGIVLVVALISLPPAAASKLFYRVPSIIFVSILLCALSGFVGILLSYETGWPTGATIIQVAVVLYLLFSLIARITGRLSRGKRSS